MIIPGNYDIPPLIKGTDYEFAFAIKSDGVPKDLTGCTITIVLSNVDGIIDTLTTSHCLIVSEDEGTILIDISNSTMANYPLGEFQYYMNITESNGDKNRYIEGRSIVRE
jgi:hypothetical protein